MAGLVLLTALLTGIAPVVQGEAEFRPTADEPQVPAAYRLGAAVFPFETQVRLESEARTVMAVRFPSPVESPDPVNNTVHAEYFQPKLENGAKAPGVVVLHILGADFALSRYFAARLADAGVAALFVKLPYYGERRPPGVDQKFLSSDMDRSLRAMRQGVCDVRRAAAWLGSRAEVDPNKLGVTGISLGGIVASIAVAVDPALDRGAFLLAGGNLAKILWEMPESARYRQAWAESGRTFGDLKALTDPFDPVRYAERLKGKHVRMFAGKVDEVVPPESARALWEAAGRPPITWYDCGHYSAVGFLMPAIREAADFLADHR